MENFETILANEREAAERRAYIDGPNTICSSSPVTYKYDPMPANHQWSASTNLSYSSSTTGTFVVTATGSGYGWIRVVDSNNNTVAIKYIWIGVPAVGMSGQQLVYSGNTTQYSATNNTDAFITSYQWMISPQGSNVIYDYGSWVSIYFPNTGNFRVSVRAQNACGWSSWYDYYVDVI